MEFFFRDIFARYEILLLFGILCAIVILFFVRGFRYLVFVRSLFHKRKNTPEVEEKEEGDREIGVHEKEVKKEKEITPLSPETRENIANLISITRTYLARGNIADAQAKIVEGLSLDKDNRTLNLLLAEIYEMSGDYKRAEIIYKDLVPVSGSDREIYTKLGESLVKQEKYDIAHEVYTKLLGFTKDPEEILYPLALVSYHLGKMDEVLDYGKRFLRNHPYDPDTLWIVAQAEIALGDTQSALDRLIKLRQLSPYNQSIADLIEELRHAPVQEKKEENIPSRTLDESEEKDDVGK